MVLLEQTIQAAAVAAAARHQTKTLVSMVEAVLYFSAIQLVTLLLLAQVLQDRPQPLGPIR
jgi:hypothetical protein